MVNLHLSNLDIFLISRKHVVGTHYKHLGEVLLMSAHISLKNKKNIYIIICILFIASTMEFLSQDK